MHFLAVLLRGALTWSPAELAQFIAVPLVQGPGLSTSLFRAYFVAYLRRLLVREVFCISSPSKSVPAAGAGQVRIGAPL